MIRRAPLEQPTLIREISDGSSRWDYRGYRFTVRRGRAGHWSCGEVSIPLHVSYPGPRQMRGMKLACFNPWGWHGWGPGGRTRCVAKIAWWVDKELRTFVKEQALAGAQPDARQAQA